MNKGMRLLYMSLGALVCAVLLAACADAESSTTPQVSQEDAIARAIDEVQRPWPEVTAVDNPRNPTARLMTLAEYEQQYAGEVSLQDYSGILVWVVELEGESQSAGTVPEHARKQYHYAVAVIDAETGDYLRGSRHEEPVLPGDEQADADSPEATSGATPTATPAPMPPERGVHTPEDFRHQYEEWPDDYKLALDDERVVRFAYPLDIGMWAGIAFIDHLPSASSVTIANALSVRGPDGIVEVGETEEIAGQRLRVHRHYKSEEGEAALEAVLSDDGLMRGIVQLARRAMPWGWPEEGPPDATVVSVMDPEKCPPDTEAGEDLRPYIAEPNTYCGEINLTNAPVRDGVKVEAVVQGNVCGTGEVQGGQYRVTVVSPYCARPGDTVYFRVGDWDYWANEAAKVTHPLMGWHLDLTLDLTATLFNADQEG